MVKVMQNIDNRLKKGVVLAELGGYGDGPYCADYGKGAALVMMGTYIVDAGDTVPYPEHFVFKPGRKNYSGYLKEHISAARQSGAAVGVSVVCVNMQDDIDFLATAEEAGADYLSLCLNSAMPMFVDAGLSSALLRRENWPELRARVEPVLKSLTRPFIVKIGTWTTSDAIEASGELTEIGVPIIHAHVPESATPESLDTIKKLKEHCHCLIVGGGIKNLVDAQMVLNAGADSISIGSAAMEEAGLCGHIQARLR